VIISQYDLTDIALPPPSLWTCHSPPGVNDARISGWKQSGEFRIPLAGNTQSLPSFTESRAPGVRVKSDDPRYLS
jgi:hypothetical protein